MLLYRGRKYMMAFQMPWWSFRRQAGQQQTYCEYINPVSTLLRRPYLTTNECASQNNDNRMNLATRQLNQPSCRRKRPYCKEWISLHRTGRDQLRDNISTISIDNSKPLTYRNACFLKAFDIGRSWVEVEFVEPRDLMLNLAERRSVLYTQWYIWNKTNRQKSIDAHKGA